MALMEGFLDGFRWIRRFPVFLAPAFFGGIIQGALLLFTWDFWQDFGISLSSGAFALPGNALEVPVFSWLAFSEVWGPAIGILGAGFLIEIGVLFVYAKMSAMVMQKKKPALGTALNATLSHWTSVVAVALFFSVIFVFFAWIIAVLAGLKGLLNGIGTILAVLAFFAAVYVYVRSVFTAPILAMHEKGLKEALNTSARFSSGRFWSIALFFGILAVGLQAVHGIGEVLGDPFLGENALAGVLVFDWIGRSYAFTALCMYYLNGVREARARKRK
ncbi:MAG: hypothetical protein HY393_01360 [Candidatus Diapherotrites archaeon]|nr:hypothetical protein [Candidatus Diapherotrites archaeon]